MRLALTFARAEIKSQRCEAQTGKPGWLARLISLVTFGELAWFQVSPRSLKALTSPVQGSPIRIAAPEWSSRTFRPGLPHQSQPAAKLRNRVPSGTLATVQRLRTSRSGRLAADRSAETSAR